MLAVDWADAVDEERCAVVERDEGIGLLVVGSLPLGCVEYCVGCVVTPPTLEISRWEGALRGAIMLPEKAEVRQRSEEAQRAVANTGDGRTMV